MERQGPAQIHSMAAVEENGPGRKKTRSPGFQVQGSIAAAFLTSLNSLPWQLGLLPHIQAVNVSEWGGGVGSS